MEILGLALGLVVLWLVVKFVFKAVGCVVHLLLLAAALAAAYWLWSTGGLG
jgi:hypothetical protein